MTHGLLRADTKFVSNPPLFIWNSKISSLLHRLQAGIVYVPEITPPPASLLRQVAYSQAVRIPGPAADPLGWHELSPATDIFGKLSNGKSAKMQCSVCTYGTIQTQYDADSTFSFFSSYSYHLRIQ